MNTATEKNTAGAAITVRPMTTPSDLLRYALDRKVDIVQLRELYELQKIWEADQAKKTFVAQMAAAKADAPIIVKEKSVSYATKGGGTTAYMHATIGNVVGNIVPWLAKHGFSHRWTTRQEGGLIYVTCTLTHEAGHSETCELFAAPDESGGKNAIQALVSAKTYLERHTLLALTGLATSDDDDDGRAGGGNPNVSAEDQKIIDQWKEHFAAIIDLEQLRISKADMIDAYKGESNVPPELLGLYLLRARAIKEAATNAS
jgi:hypothetical protein